MLRPWRCDLASCPRKGRHEQRPSGCFFSCVAPQGGVSVSPAPRRRGSHTQSVAPWPPLLDCCSQPLAEAQHPLPPALVLGATPTYAGVCNEEPPRGRAPTPSSSLLLPSEAAREAYSPLPLDSGLHAASYEAAEEACPCSLFFFPRVFLAMGPLVLRHGLSGACPSL